MLSIKDNHIKLTRGDSMTLTVALKRGEESYTPAEGDTIRFALSTGYVGQSGYQLILQQEIPADTMTLTLGSAQTKQLSYRKYNYDIQITHDDGTVDTVISATLTVTGEVE